MAKRKWLDSRDGRDMNVRRCLLAIGAVCLALGVATGANAQRAKTPEATHFGIWVVDSEHFMVGIVETVAGTDEGVGFAIRCVRDTGELEGSMAFGFFPPGKRVQAAVRTPSGRVERFGPVVVGRRGSGFHVPIVEGRSEVLRLAMAALRDGALISNGHNSVWNRVGEVRNREGRDALRRCSGGT